MPSKAIAFTKYNKFIRYVQWCAEQEEGATCESILNGIDSSITSASPHPHLQSWKAWAQALHNNNRQAFPLYVATQIQPRKRKQQHQGALPEEGDAA
jgi:hypothetical protein